MIEIENDQENKIIKIIMLNETVYKRNPDAN